MQTYDRPSPRKRQEALERLRSLTTGVVVAGIAATAGFGFAAANGYTGTGSQGVTTAGGTVGSQNTTVTQGTTVAPNVNPAPFNDGQFGSGFQAPQTQPGAGIQVPTFGRGSGHASTGGSG